jgi:hypothetical protein
LNSRRARKAAESGSLSGARKSKPGESRPANEPERILISMQD